MKLIIKIASILSITAMASCVSVPEKLTAKPKLPAHYDSVGYKENYWALYFKDIATFSIHSDKIVLHDEDINLSIPYNKIIKLEFDKPVFTDPNNYIIVTFKLENEVITGYFTAYEYGGWVANTDEMYQKLLYAYENKKI